MIGTWISSARMGEGFFWKMDSWMEIVFVWLMRRRKRAAREVHKRSDFVKRVHGLRAKLFAKKRHAEKVQMKKTYDPSLSLSLFVHSLSLD